MDSEVENAIEKLKEEKKRLRNALHAMTVACTAEQYREAFYEARLALHEIK